MLIFSISLLFCCKSFEVKPSEKEIIVSGKNVRAINNEFYGNNYWCWDRYTDTIHGTESQGLSLNLGLLRAGGYNNDAQKSYKFDPFDYSQIDEYVDYCKKIRAEPLLQVPILKNIRNEKATKDDAAELVHYCNIEKKYNIKYWSIGNEPDQYAEKDLPRYTVDDYCNDFVQFSEAMKEVDDTIMIMGPEITRNHYFPFKGKNDWLTPFLIRCKGYYDIVAIHRYPFEASECTINSAVRDSLDYTTIIASVRKQMNELEFDSIGLYRIKYNVEWKNDRKYLSGIST